MQIRIVKTVNFVCTQPIITLSNPSSLAPIRLVKLVKFHRSEAGVDCESDAFFSSRSGSDSIVLTRDSSSNSFLSNAPKSLAADTKLDRDLKKPLPVRRDGVGVFI